MKIIIGADHRGYEMKERLKPWLLEQGHEVLDVGAYVLDNDDDYPDFVRPMVEEILKSAVPPPNGGATARGVFLARSGQGEAIAGNRHKGIFAVAYYHHNLEEVKLNRTDNNANMLCVGTGFVSESEAKEAIEAFITTPFDSNSRHARRLAKIDK